MLGHDDAAMTLDVYAYLFEDDLDDVANRLDAALAAALAASVRPEAPIEEPVWWSRPRRSGSTRQNGWRPQQDSNLRHKV